MLFAVYKSSKKADTYLYIAQKDKFDEVPDALLQSFGQPQFVMVVNAAKRARLAGLPVNEFIQRFDDKGFYLQLPPTLDSLLEQHKKAHGKDQS